MKSIFISYSWKNGKIADTLDSFFRTKGIELRRDIRDLNITDSIKAFMKTIRRSDYSLMVISEDYLKSTNCMYEVLEFIKDDDFVNRILPLIHKDTNIFDQSGRNKYIIYWQEKYKELNKDLDSLEELNRIDTLVELKKIKEIQSGLSEFLKIISDMNSIVYYENITLDDFSKIYKVIDPSSDFLSDEIDDGYFMLNVPRTLKNHLMIWWEKESKGYSTDLKRAKIFSLEEVKHKLSQIDSERKFAAVPISVAMKFGQSIIPRDYEFLKIIRDSNEIMGNRMVQLSDEEISLLI